MHTEPIVIHKGTKVMDTWQIGRPKGFSMGASENGWITKRLFYKYGKIFINYLTDRGLTENGKNLLVMDSHNSYTFNFQFMKLRNDNNVVVLALPPHTTHAMQPLDDIPFVNFKNEWYEVVCKFVCKYAAKKITKYEWFNLFMPCWRKTITVKNIQAGF